MDSNLKIYNSVIELDQNGTVIAANFGNTLTFDFTVQLDAAKPFTPLLLNPIIEFNRIGDNVKFNVKEGFTIKVWQGETGGTGYGSFDTQSDLVVTNMSGASISAVKNNEATFTGHSEIPLQFLGSIPYMRCRMEIPFAVLLPSVYLVGDTVEVDAEINLTYTLDQINNG